MGQAIYSPSKAICIPPFGLVDVSMYASIIDSHQFQLLKHKTQNSLTKEVFPCATHTRYSHSIAAMHVARVLLRSMFERGFFADENYKEKEYDLCAAALLHDIGHPPYSHILEYVLADFSSSKIPKNHKDRTKQIILDSFGDELKRNGTTPERVAALLNNNTKSVGQIITNKTVGADKIAYLAQDHYMAGYGSISPMDWRGLEYYIGYNPEKGVVVEEKSVGILKAMQRFYIDMWTQVYFRKQCLASGRMLQKALELHISATHIDCDDIWEKTESWVDNKLAESPVPAVQELSRRLLYRDLPKAAIVIKDEKYSNCERCADKPISVIPVPEEELSLLTTRYERPSVRTTLEQLIAHELKLNAEDVSVTVAHESEKLDIDDIEIVDNRGNSVGTIFKRFPAFFSSLQETKRAYTNIYVMVTAEQRRRVAAMAEDVVSIIKN